MEWWDVTFDRSVPSEPSTLRSIRTNNLFQEIHSRLKLKTRSFLPNFSLQSLWSAEHVRKSRTNQSFQRTSFEKQRGEDDVKRLVFARPPNSCCFISHISVCHLERSQR